MEPEYTSFCDLFVVKAIKIFPGGKDICSLHRKKQSIGLNTEWESVQTSKFREIIYIYNIYTSGY